MPKKLIKAAVIGDPISHSLSPKIHNYFLNKYDINGSYEAICLTKENFSSGIRELIELGFAGFNVTIPHKESALKICDHLSNSARQIGAVNTIAIMKNGELFGHNSDAEGFIKNLYNHCPNLKLEGKKIALIGAGGAARAIIYAFLNDKVEEIIITNRNPERAENLINDFAKMANKNNSKLKFLSKENFEKEVKDAHLIVNSTSLGMNNQEKLDFNFDNLNKNIIIYDIVYKPLITDLLNFGQINNNKIITGIGMLIQQALVGFEMWFGVKPELDLDFENNILNNSY